MHVWSTCDVLALFSQGIMVLCSHGDPSPGPGQFSPHQLFKCSPPPPGRRPDSSVTEEVRSKPPGSSLASLAPNLRFHLAPPPCRLSQAGWGRGRGVGGVPSAQPQPCLAGIRAFLLSWGLHSIDHSLSLPHLHLLPLSRPLPLWLLNLKIKNKAQSQRSASFSGSCLPLLCAVRLLQPSVRPLFPLYRCPSPFLIPPGPVPGLPLVSAALAKVPRDRLVTKSSGHFSGFILPDLSAAFDAGFRSLLETLLLGILAASFSWFPSHLAGSSF